MQEVRLHAQSTGCVQEVRVLCEDESDVTFDGMSNWKMVIE